MDNGIGRDLGNLLGGGKRIQQKAKRPPAKYYPIQVEDHPAALRRQAQADHGHVTGRWAGVRRTQQVAEPIKKRLAEKQGFLGGVNRQRRGDFQRQPRDILVQVLGQQAIVKGYAIALNGVCAFDRGQLEHQRLGIKLDGIGETWRYPFDKAVQPRIKAEGVIEQRFLNELGAGRIQQNNKLDALCRIPGGIIALPAQSAVILDRHVKPQAAGQHRQHPYRFIRVLLFEVRQTLLAGKLQFGGEVQPTINAVGADTADNIQREGQWVCRQNADGFRV
ncbi:hypothetical protein SOD10_31560 [Serratia plymuthica]|nr:hypothetical protein SOD10_31560 [Serratia plymuthica]